MQNTRLSIIKSFWAALMVFVFVLVAFMGSGAAAHAAQIELMADQTMEFSSDYHLGHLGTGEQIFYDWERASQNGSSAQAMQCCLSAQDSKGIAGSFLNSANEKLKQFNFGAQVFDNNEITPKTFSILDFRNAKSPPKEIKLASVIKKE